MSAADRGASWLDELADCRMRELGGADSDSDMSDPDLIVPVGRGYTWIEPGRYHVCYVRHHLFRPFGGPKVEIELEVMDGEHAGAIVCACRHVIQAGPRTAISAPRNGKLMRELRCIAGQRGMAISMALLRGVGLDAQVAAARTDGEPYSVVEHIVGVWGARASERQKDPTAAERKRRQRARQRAEKSRGSGGADDRDTTVTYRDIPRDKTVTNRDITVVTPPKNPRHERLSASHDGSGSGGGIKHQTIASSIQHQASPRGCSRCAGEGCHWCSAMSATEVPS